MDAVTLYRNLENNVLRRDRLSKKLKRSCRKALSEEGLSEIVAQVKALRTSRRALMRMLERVKSLESYEGFGEPMITMIEYMSLVGVHVERDALRVALGVLQRREETKRYAEEIASIDMVEIERLEESLRTTYSILKSRLST